MHQPLVKKKVKKTLSGDFAKILIIKSRSFQPFPPENNSSLVLSIIQLAPKQSFSKHKAGLSFSSSRNR
jgi:hypothetical protein